MSSCRYCGKAITWIQDGRKKTPVEVDGVPHQCEEFKKARRSVKKMDRGDIDPELIKKYEQTINKKK